MRRIRIVMSAALALALPAAAAPLDDAKRALDAVAPMHCEVLKMKHQVDTAQGDPKAFRKRSQAIEQETAGDMQRFELARAQLDAAARDELAAYGLALMQACAQSAGIPVPAASAPREVKVMPYRPGEKALGVQGVPGSPIQGQDPQ